MEPVPVFDERFRERIQKYKVNFVKKQSVSLKKHFMALLMGESKIIGTDDCRRILKMLHPNFKLLNDMELSRFGQVLRYYMKSYPCWDELAIIYKNKTVDEKDVDNWYTDFTIYLTLKMEDTWEISKSLKDDKSGRLSQQETQTNSDQQPITSCSNFSIELEGPPSLAYSAVFNMSEGDVVAGQHLTIPFSVGRYQCKSSFLNLPYVSIQAKFADFSFERRNVHKIERFIITSPLNFKKNYTKTVKTERIDQEKPVSVFTLRLFHMYFRQFMQILQKERSISDTQKREFVWVVEEVLKDMEEAFVCSTFPTNVKVTFTIGDNIYIRNKRTATRDIDFYEIITPTVAFSMDHFDAKQDMNDRYRISFESLNFFEKSKDHFIEHMNSPRIKFECQLCSRYFLSMCTIQSHFEQEHKEEHVVTCGKCKKAVEVASLVANRWRHLCRSSQQV